MNNNTQPQNPLDSNSTLSALAFMTNMHEQSMPKDPTEQVGPPNSNQDPNHNPDNTNNPPNADIQALQAQLGQLQSKMDSLSQGAEEKIKQEVDQLRQDISDAITNG